MQYNDKNKHERDKKTLHVPHKDKVVKLMTFYASRSHIWAVHIYVLWV